MNSHRPIWSRIIDDQRFRFLVVGSVNTLVGYLLFAAFTTFLFAEVPFGYLISLVLSYVIAIMIAFLLYRRFVFKVAGRWWLDFVRFVSVYLAAIGINFVTLPILVELAGLPPLLAQGIVLIATTALSFVGHKAFSFRRRTPPSDESSPLMPGGQD